MRVYRYVPIDLKKEDWEYDIPLLLIVIIRPGKVATNPWPETIGSERT